MNKLVLLSFLTAMVFACESSNSSNSKVKSHPLAELVNETIILSPGVDLDIEAGEVRKVSLGELNAEGGSVLVYITADMKLTGADLNAVSIKLIEPPYYDGKVYYSHEIFTPSSKEDYNGTVNFEDVELKGNNPGDESVDGEWFVEISNASPSASATVNSLTLKVHTRLD
ncbi:hypothetical protein [Pseudobacteriovorax antillogorgiicola]|uniref:DUF3859 domain-containing protein n=1 Tax=Pseudobacteriovorax antillogorgiicola TaxID=1513793 RepID=A0A1Y6CH95_9BACT|nr:hypothetical protein [Pseudobacteriovorax antillogorgiicola]TCS47017.1 hypothetical protein EDD56_122112 [Pseudobacteriovorax antillogorgiicola]SMF65160.1 hypothetical protein SAMN06296036_122112 [Pseudobacteriovorax antillogorgiicola]